MKKRIIKLLSGIVVFSLVVTLFGGCVQKAETDTTTETPNISSEDQVSAGDEKEPEVITLRFFDKNTGDPFGQDPVSKEIIKRTGVQLEMEQPTGDPTEKLNILLASGDLPDLILMSRTDDLVNKYIAAKAFIPLNELMDQYGNNVKEMYGDVLIQTRYKDGKNYYLSNWYGVEQEPVFGMLMRRNLLREVAPDKADGGNYFTAEEFIDVLHKVKETHPTLNDHETIPMTFWADNWGAIIGTFKGMYGMKTYYEVDGELKYDFRDPKYLDMVKYMNRLYREGLLDEEWPVNKQQLWEQKLSNGYVFATQGAYWDLGTVNNILGAEDPENEFYSYKVVAPGVDTAKTTYGAKSGLGWDAIGITRSNQYPERTMQFIDFLASEEGQYLLMWGLEGDTWEMKDGKHVPKGGVLEEFRKDWDSYTKKTGIRKWTWFIKNGLGADGTPYDLPGRYERAEEDLFAIKNLKDSTWDSAPYDGLGAEGGTPEALISQKIDDLSKQAIPRAILAQTEEEAVEVFRKFVRDAEAAGAAKVERIITDNYKVRMELWK